MHKRRQLELTAFGPFIDDLEPSRYREKVADRAFGRSGEPGEALTESSVLLFGRPAEIIRGGKPPQ